MQNFSSPFFPTLEVNGGADSRMPSLPSRSLSRMPKEFGCAEEEEEEFEEEGGPSRPSLHPSLISLNRSMTSSLSRDRLLEDDLGNFGGRGCVQSNEWLI